jgi:ABC-type multidrug transport system ATPase subunit
MDEAQRLCDRVAIVSDGRVVDDGAPGDLIAAHLAPEAVEIDCTPEEESALLDGTIRSARRLRVGRRVTFYLSDAAPLVERVHAADHHRPLVVRPTNLEDVFLALTGTSLEAAA